jgi:hypothetical protein
MSFVRRSMVAPRLFAYAASLGANPVHTITRIRRSDVEGERDWWADEHIHPLIAAVLAAIRETAPSTTQH